MHESLHWSIYFVSMVEAFIAGACHVLFSSVKEACTAAAVPDVFRVSVVKAGTALLQALSFLCLRKVYTTDVHLLPVWLSSACSVCQEVLHCVSLCNLFFDMREACTAFCPCCICSGFKQKLALLLPVLCLLCVCGGSLHLGGTVQCSKFEDFTSFLSPQYWSKDSFVGLLVHIHHRSIIPPVKRY